MNHTRAALAASLLPVVLAPAAAQDGLTTPDRIAALAAQVRVPIHRAPVAGNPSPGLWAAGADYKVTFDGGATFVPYLGEAATENAVFRWRTLALGETATTVDAQAAPPHVAPYRCEYDRGLVTETYDVLVEGLEQSFVFAAAPAGTGDLALRGEITGNLHAEPRARAHATIPFRDSMGRIVFRYGAAHAIDAAGQRTPLETSVDGDVVSIHLPRALLDDAVYPLTIDPLWSPVLLSSSTSTTPLGGGYKQLAIERDNASYVHDVMIAYTRVASLFDSDVVALVCNEDFSDPHAVFAELVSTIVSDEPDVVFVGGAGRWVIALSRTGSSPGCYYHLHDGGSTALGTNLTAFATPGTDRDSHPRVGGSRHQTGGSHALLVRQRDPAAAGGNSGSSSIWASVLDVASGSEQTPVQLAGGVLVDAENPAVSKECLGGSWVVAWQSWSGLASTEWHAKARRVSNNGGLAFGTLSSDRTFAGVHELSPRVDGTLGRYLLTFGEVDSTYYPGKITGYNFGVLRAMRFDWYENAGSPSTQPSHLVWGATARNLTPGGVAYDTVTRSHWAVGATNLAIGTFYLHVLGFHGATVYHEEHTVPSALPDDPWHAVCFDDSDQQFLSVLAPTVQQGGNYVSSLWGYVYAYPSLTLTTNGTACTSASIGVVGQLRRGSEFGQLTMTGAPANLPALLIAGGYGTTLPLDPFGMAGCTLYVDPTNPGFVTLAATVDGAGVADVPLPLPESVGQQALWFQWAHLAPGANELGIVFTEGMRAGIL
ncbi:MAG TPA: hypothetical protein VFZ65_13460 [Planctomycetota bacterium]|nr:hypothetical protein [Planctomycetota bacterium]